MRNIKNEIRISIDAAAYRRKGGVVRMDLLGEVDGHALSAGRSLWGEVNRAAPFLLVDIRDDIKNRMK